MKISFFRDYEKKLAIQHMTFSEYNHTALIDVETGFFRKKKEAKKIFKHHDSVDWKFADNGEFVPYIITGMFQSYLIYNNIEEK